MYKDKRHHNCKLSYEQELEAINKYKSGLGLESVGKLFDVNMVTILNVLKGHNIPRRKNGNPIKVLDENISTEIINLYKDGLTQVEIAKKYNTSQKKISELLRFNNIDCGSRAKDKHHNWKGGKLITKAGYVYVQITKDSPYSSMAISSGYVLEHRLNMAKHIQRPLTKNESVHHINGNTKDNRIENLQLRQGQHGIGQVYVCCDCGSHNVKSTKL
jgi:hypothetical protein